MIDLILDDCMNVMKDYDDNHFDLAIVDPPYGIDAGKMTMGSGKHNFTKDISCDSDIPDKKYFVELFRVSKNQVIWGGNYFTKYLKPSRHWLLWDKLNPNLSFAEGEMAWVNNGKNLRIFKHYSARVEYGGKIHPTQKPVELYKWILHNYSNKGEKILDTHLGSGSIAVACYYAGVDLVGVEIDEEYYNKAKKRVDNLTKQGTLF